MNKVKTLFCLLASMAALSSRAGVSSVVYGISYDTVTCRWNMYMKVTGGSAANALERTASTAKLSIVIPTALTVGTTVYSNQPKIGSKLGSVITFTGGSANWTLANPYAPISGPLVGYTVYDYNVSPSSAFWPQLATGDSLSLFELEIPTAACGADIRLWNNNAIQGTTITSPTPDPISANMNGKDYNNGMSFNGTNSLVQAYSGKIATVGPPKPKVTASRTLTSNSIVLSATATPGSACSAISTYEWVGPKGPVPGTTASRTITPITAADFGVYSITVTDNQACAINLALSNIPLPVKLSRFDGVASKCNAILSWQTASETSFDRFELQYSTDGASFMSIGQVSSKKQAGGNEYTYSYAPASGKGYYRLKMVDLNGTFSYSETVTVQTSCGAAAGQISISPNPTSGNVSVRGIAAGTEIRIMDMVGKVVANEVSNGASITFDLSKYANGVYNVLVAQNGAWEKVGQIVKN